MNSKQIVMQVKDAGESDGLAEGQFTAYASVFDNVDSYGDVVRKGAFADDLAEWEHSGNPIPVLWGHDMGDMHNNIGAVVEASEDDRGLLVKAQLDLDHPNGQQAHRLIREKRVTDLSFAYDVVEASDGQVDGEDVTELTKLKLYEVSVVPVGANRETEFLAVKTTARDVAAKAGRVVSADDEKSLRVAVASLSEASQSVEDVLASLDGESAEVQDGKARTCGPDKSDEDPGVGKSDEDPASKVPARSLAARNILISAQMGAGSDSK